METEEARYVFRYEVETMLWENPFDKTVIDEAEYIKERRKNAYHDLKRFSNEDPLVARRQAFSYLQSMLEVLCESIGKPYCDYWQAVKDLQPLLRADHPLAHQRVGIIQFDDDLLCGVSLTMIVEKGKKRDHVAIFNLGVYDDEHKEDILSDVAYSIVELERERRYYQLAQIPKETERIALAGIGMPDVEVIPSIMDWQDFSNTFCGIDIDDIIDTTTILNRQCEPLIY
ncbi:MAG: hypothetical protein IJ634_08470 [Bacteroidales bacterium]|nr:hypothetical protein [Bacteroidales bacterium]